MIALDTNALSVMFIPGAVVSEPGADKPIKYAKERMEFLVERLARAGETIIIPTPVLAELLAKVLPERIPKLLTELGGSRWFRIESFDTPAAVELGARTAKAIASGDKREGSKADHTKVKFDRQILVIAMVSGANELISNDPHLVSLGERWDFPVRGVHDLPLPPSLIIPPILVPLEESDGKIASLPNMHP